MPIYGPSSTADDSIWKKSISGEGNSHSAEFLFSCSDAISPTQTSMYAWFRLKCPVGYSDAGIPRCWEITSMGAGSHAANSVMLKHYIVESNDNHVGSSGLRGTCVDLVYQRYTSASGTYGATLIPHFYYKNNCSAWNTGEVYMSVRYQFREPAITVHFKTLGCTDHGVTYRAPTLTDVEFIGAHSSESEHEPGNKTSITIEDPYSLI
jgi:hypothetical protein